MTGTMESQAATHFSHYWWLILLLALLFLLLSPQPAHG
jgi:hypothetical protein